MALAAAGESVESAMAKAMTADSNGRFTIKGVSSGRYTVIAQADGYFSFLNDPVLASRAKRDVIVIEGQQIEVGAIELLPGAAISGRIVAPDGHPVIGAVVQAWRASYVRGRLTFSLTKTASTDDIGEYFVCLSVRREVNIKVTA